ncbi:MAG: DNA polymerase III subunit delta [Acidobacteria bacterium]|nr:DNA polymerase III subunit delta [Acidobacteriota bacterium]
MMVPGPRALERILNGTIAPGYLLLGRETYWRDRIWSALRRNLNLESDSTGLSDVDLRQSSLDLILAQAAERNLWSPRQLILVRNAQTLSGAKPLETLAHYFRDPNPDSILVFEMTDVDLETDDWREREKVKTRQDHWEPLCDVVLLASPSMRESLELVRREAAARGCKLTPQAAENLVALLDCNLGRIVKELDKLCLFRAEGEEISADDVNLLAGSRGASQALSLPEAIGTGDVSKVLEAFDDLIPKGAYLPLVISDLARYLRQLLLLQERRVRDSREASKILWSASLPAPQSLLPELVRQSRALPPQHVVRRLQGALRAEVALRSSPADDRLIVERFLLDIARPLRRPQAPGVQPMRAP